MPAEESNRGEPWDLFPISVCSADRNELQVLWVSKYVARVLMAIYMSVPRGFESGRTNKYAARNDLIHADREWSTASSRCIVKPRSFKRLAKFIFDSYTLVHKYTDILIKFYIREIYFDISYNFNWNSYLRNLWNIEKDLNNII